MPFDRVLYALSIPFVGETVSRKIARAVRSIDNLMAMSREELVALDDVGPRIADSIIEFFAYEPNLKLVERLRAAGVQMSLPEEDLSDHTDLLGGKSIVISGVFSLHSREEYKALIEKMAVKMSVPYPKRPIMCWPETIWDRQNLKKQANSAYLSSTSSNFSK